jgi:tetratricopeptide (TPR) repeat protein
VDESFLVSFFRDLREQDRAGGREPETARGRDLGLALSVDPPDPKSPGFRVGDDARASQLALTLLEQSLRANHDDPDAWAARGRALERLGRSHEALASFQVGLQLDPGSESLLLDVANRQLLAGETVAALPLLHRLIAINPWRADYHTLLATGLSNSRDWKAAAEACRAALALNAFDTDARVMLVRALFEAHDRGAEREFETLARSNPEAAAKLGAGARSNPPR